VNINKIDIRIQFSDLSENKIIKIDDRYFICKKATACNKCFFFHRACVHIDCGNINNRYSLVEAPPLFNMLDFYEKNKK
jgi:hypothetical protein